MRLLQGHLKRLSVFGLAMFVCVVQTCFAAEAPKELAQTTVRHPLLAELLILFGCIFILAAGIGMFRFPDFYTRVHASSKLVTLGGLGIFLGAAFSFIPESAVQRVLLMAVFFLLTAPIAGYMIARAGYLRGLRPYREADSVDEWQACGAEAE
jgi:multicomponent Na+:H+ antiporter subunit G